MDDVLLEEPANVLVTVAVPDELREAVQLHDVELAPDGHNHWPRNAPIRALIMDWTAEVRDVPPGTWSVRASGRLKNGFALRLGERKIEVFAGIDQQVSLAIADTLFHGRVTHRGEPVKGVINLNAAGELRARSAVAYLDDDGRFQVLLEQRGKYQANVQQAVEKARRADLRAGDRFGSRRQRKRGHPRRRSCRDDRHSHRGRERAAPSAAVLLVSDFASTSPRRMNSAVTSALFTGRGAISSPRLATDAAGQCLCGDGSGHTSGLCASESGCGPDDHLAARNRRASADPRCVALRRCRPSVAGRAVGMQHSVCRGKSRTRTGRTSGDGPPPDAGGYMVVHRNAYPLGVVVTPHRSYRRAQPRNGVRRAVRGENAACHPLNIRSCSQLQIKHVRPDDASASAPARSKISMSAPGVRRRRATACSSSATTATPRPPISVVRTTATLSRSCPRSRNIRIRGPIPMTDPSRRS